MGLGHNDPWVESHIRPQKMWGQRSSRGQWPLFQFFCKNCHCIHILDVCSGETRGSRTTCCNFLDQLIHPYKFNGRDMSGILFFIFASCEPLSQQFWCKNPSKFVKFGRICWSQKTSEGILPLIIGFTTTFKQTCLSSLNFMFFKCSIYLIPRSHPLFFVSIIHLSPVWV